jgi:lysophospholipase L1-like esterase
MKPMRNAFAQNFNRRAVSALLAGALLVLPAANSRAAILAKSGQTIVFLGDSITQFGWQNPRGYVRLVLAGLETNGVKVVPVPAGVAGDKSNQMLARLKRDVLDKKPDWMTLSCGVNDVWHGTNGVPLAQYMANVTAIVDQCQAAGIKVMILTATGIGEDLDNQNNQKLAAYNEFLRALAREKKCLLADLNALFQETLRESAKPGRLLTVDGVHMNQIGDQIMARGVLQAFGLDDAEMEKAEQAWFRIFINAPPRTNSIPGKGK